MKTLASRLVPIFLALTTPPGARAEPVEDFYKGKTITFFIGSTSGTAYDLYARALARHLPRFMPGSPATVAQNMPGASALIAANHVANIAPKDGTAIAALTSMLPYQPLMGVQSVRFDAIRANWLPSPGGYTGVLVVSHKAAAQTLDELRQKEIRIATMTPGSTPHFYAALFNELFGTKMRFVSGHPSMPSTMLATERGEVDGFPIAPWPTLRRNYAEGLARKTLTPILQFGPKPIPELGDTPFALDLIRDDEDRKLAEIAMAPLILGYPLMLAPEVPKERVAALRKAIMDMVRDPAFLAEAERQTLDIDAVSGEDAQKIVEAAYAAPTGVIERARRIYETQTR
jgi:tripartite-type tricarboxylate transporter receptor subunit TctC